MSFGKSIGGGHGSGNISSTSIGQNRASGGPVAGYAAGKGYGAQGRPAPEYGAAGGGPTPKPQPAKACDEAKTVRSDGKVIPPPNGGRF
jgi:hypothetical protein